MKILHVVPGIEQVSGGTSRAVIEICVSLAKLGCEVHLATTRDSLNKYQLISFESLKDKIYFFDRWKREDFAFSASLGKWLSKNIKKYDIVHIHSLFNYPSYIAAVYARKARIPYLIAPHGMLEPWALSYKAWKKSLSYTLFIKPILEKANAIHVISSPEANNISTIGLKNRLIFIPNGIDCQDFETLPDPRLFYQKFSTIGDKKIILFLGRIDPKKGLDLLARAFTDVHQQFPDTHLVIAGEPTVNNMDFLDTAKSYFTATGYSNAVTFTGMLSGRIKYAALAASSIYVAPSYSEGFSMSVLEGMASGLPCVITTGCNFPEAAARQVACVVECDANEIAKALIHCLQNPQQAKNMGKHARQFIFEDYTWERTAEKLIDVYKEMQSN